MKKNNIPAPHPVLLAGALLATLVGCDAAMSSDLEVERLPEVKANLPPVPTLPPPPHPVQYDDSSYSLFGLRKRLEKTIDSNAEVTGYIVEIYEPPECPKGETCPLPVAPHAWLADTPDGKDPLKRIAIVGYAENQKQVAEAVAAHKRGSYKPPPEETGLPPIPVDFEVGNKVKVKGRFTRVSASGFNISNGLLEYQGHTTL